MKFRERAAKMGYERARVRTIAKSQCNTFPHLGTSDSLTYNWVKHSTTMENDLNPQDIAPNFESVKHSLLELIAESPSTEASTLEVLAHSPSIRVRQAVADNPRTPLTALRLLATDFELEVRFALAENHNVPMEILEMLHEDENPYVSERANLTMNNLNCARMINNLKNEI